METMPEKPVFDTVVTIKMTTGEDIIGANMGIDEQGMLAVYKPIRVLTRTHVTENGTGVLKVPELYCPFSKSSVMLIDMSSILTMSVVSKFYERYYWFTLGNLISHEEGYQKYMLDAFETHETEEMLGDKDSINLHAAVETKQ